MIEILAQITSDGKPKFTAGLVLWDNKVVEAAPIIAYMKKQKWDRARVRAYCKFKGWKISVVHQMERDGDPEGTIRRRKAEGRDD